MKAYGIVAILSLVLLTAAGYTITAWQHITLEDSHNEEHLEDKTGNHSEDTTTADTHDDNDTSETIGASTSGVGQNNTSSDDDDKDHTSDEDGSNDSDSTSSTQTADNSSTTENNNTEASSSNEASSSESTSTGATSNNNEDTNTSSASNTEESSPSTTTTASTMPDELEVSLAVQTERLEDSSTPLVTIELKVMGNDLNLDGWRLGDSIGVAGHPDHLFYFGKIELADGDTLTIHSSCGRDEGLTMYWCLSQPLTMLDSGRKELFLLDSNDDVALTCRPASDEQTSSMAYECI
jgi:hypothetical protein